MFGVAVEVFGGRHLADLAGVHDADAVGVSGDDSEVVGDHEERRPELLGEVFHQLEDLGLDGDVERGRGFVGDQEARVAAEGDGDHDALSLSAAEHVGIVSDARRRIGDANHVEEFLGAGRGLSAGHAEVLLKWFDDLSSDGQNRVEGCERLLEDDADSRAADVSHLADAELKEVGAFEDDLSVDDASGGIGHEAGDGEGADALAAAGFSDEADGFALVDVEVDTIDGSDDAEVGVEFGLESSDVEEVTGGRGYCHW